ncbi:hypothetical protein PTKIN_Ptkin07bG0250700 [Pterospermum kingtungense]
MALSISVSGHLPYHVVKIFISFLLLLPYGRPLFFNPSNFSPKEQNILFVGDAFSSDNVLRLTKNEAMGNLTTGVGRVSYNQPLLSTPNGRYILVKGSLHYSIPAQTNSSRNNIVAVEFDGKQNEGDPSDDHVGININSVVSVKTVTWESSMKNGSRAKAWVSYNSTTRNLSVFLTYADNPVFSGNSSLSHIVDLRDILPEWVRIGFSSRARAIEQHTLVSWQFSSSLNTAMPNKGNERRIKILVASLSGALVLGSIVACLAFWWWKQQKSETKEKICLPSISHNLEREAGPRRFSYRDLVLATDNFADEKKLGQGGFGAVYKGHLADLDMDIAVKKILKDSKQGEKEYITEVKVISRLRHRNLVQLLGWCHDRSHQFLLVYELMPNGSLDSHLFSKNCTLTWALRSKICVGLANALQYLHNDWEQCVVHRDIKAANVMLDSEFNVKLGDFGLAKLMDHELAAPTTHLAGTLGYMAPEYIKTGRPSSKSDVFSFGVVTLELATGRRSRDPRNYDIGLVEWVWNLYEQESLLSAVDERLQMEFDQKQAERMIFVGVWCTHPDHNLRPSIRQAIQVLQFEAGMPDFSAKMPVTYSAPSISKIPSVPSITNSLIEAGR